MAVYCPSVGPFRILQTINYRIGLPRTYSCRSIVFVQRLAALLWRTVYPTTAGSTSTSNMALQTSTMQTAWSIHHQTSLKAMSKSLTLPVIVDPQWSPILLRNNTEKRTLFIHFSVTCPVCAQHAGSNQIQYLCPPARWWPIYSLRPILHLGPSVCGGHRHPCLPTLPHRYE